MLFWFLGLSFVLVVAVFRDAALDERLVMAAAVLPAVLDLAVGGVRFLHTLAYAILLLTVVMLGTIRRRGLRRRLLALPIGAFMNLVLDGMWSSTRLILWPLGGLSFGDEQLPTLGRPWPLRLAMEAAGLAALAWSVRRFRLLEPENRARFLRSGRLDRRLIGPSGRS
ncbi:MAG: hypothetical protein ABIS47_03425 [Acidimicrobiales bacterium]